MEKQIKIFIEELNKLEEDKKIHYINEMKKAMHEISPFKNEPVDCVLWVKNDLVNANDYNPNAVASPEMELLRLSINNDGYTQPIVAMEDEEQENKIVVIDGFHRNRVGKEYKEITERVKGYLPITLIRESQKGRNDRIASTIRHNRARGKHKIEAMTDIVLELKRRNWSMKKIGKQLGMQQDEVLRLTQISGLIDMFTDEDFSQAWEAQSYEEVEEIDSN